jgi:5-formyltetrahydrofolate cyclo-ligase
MLSKKEARLICRKRQAPVHPDYTDDDRKTCEAIASSTIWKESSLVIAYLPMPTETDITPLLDLAIKEKRLLAVPITDKNTTGIMHFRLLETNWRKTIGKGPWNLQEPRITETRAIDVWSQQGNIIVLVPSLGIDRYGNRLGHGGGYYDRFLAMKTPATSTVAPCRDYQLIEDFEPDKTDCRIDFLATANGFKKTDVPIL